MNTSAIYVIYRAEMMRAWNTLFQTIASPVISTSLYFVVFGAAIGSKITAIDGVEYGLFIVPGLTMLSLLTQSISNASFGIFFPKFNGTIYEILAAPLSFFRSHDCLCRRGGDQVTYYWRYYFADRKSVCRLTHSASVLDAYFFSTDLYFV